MSERTQPHQQFGGGDHGRLARPMRMPRTGQIRALIARTPSAEQHLLHRQHALMVFRSWQMQGDLLLALGAWTDANPPGTTLKELSAAPGRCDDIASVEIRTWPLRVAGNVEEAAYWINTLLTACLSVAWDGARVDKSVRQTLTAHRCRVTFTAVENVSHWYAPLHGDWSESEGRYRPVRLDEACRAEGVKEQGLGSGTRDEALRLCRLIRAVAARSDVLTDLNPPKRS